MKKRVIQEEVFETEINQNPLLERVRIPGETFTLPSKGILYDDTILSPKSRDTGEIHVYPMTAIDEIIMKSPDKLFSGAAVEEIFLKCIPDVLKPLDLFAKDIDFLMTCLRKVSYGDDLAVTFTHNCKDAKVHSYVVKMSAFIRSVKYLDPIISSFSTVLENGQEVELQPIKFRTVVEMSQVLNQDSGGIRNMDPEKAKEHMVKTLVAVIKRVDEVSDRDFIAEWIKVIPVSWAKVISDTIQNTANWGAEFKCKEKCKDCGEETNLDIPLNPLSFFLMY